MDRKIYAVIPITIAVFIIAYFAFAMVNGNRGEIVQKFDEAIATEEYVPEPYIGPELRCEEDYPLSKKAENFDLTVQQALVLKEEWHRGELGFEEFCGFLLTIEVEAEAFDSSLQSVANNLIEYGYGLIRRDELGRLELRYGDTSY